MKINIFWFRRDLRLNDNHGLFEALKSSEQVLPVFIFDTEILNALEDKSDARVSFIYNSLEELRKQLLPLGKDIAYFYGKPLEVWKNITEIYDVNQVFTNRDYEPYALARDKEISSFLKEKGISFYDFKDHVIFELQEILSGSGTPYTVFTPYSKKWKSQLQPNDYEVYDSHLLLNNLFNSSFEKQVSLEEMGFKPSRLDIPSTNLTSSLLASYHETRDYPGIAGTSKLGIHLRFGTISIRSLIRKAITSNETFLNELIWRDFYAMILANFPHVANQAFKPTYDRIQWLNNEDEFKKWCEGKTGYPLVDAGMRELNSTGYMHNRVRMVTASFLVKHLLIDWRWGEAYFAKKLLDFDLASNNGGWQWAAGSGCDAAPYFRVFNPMSQQQKFDKNWTYIKKWIPELNSLSYPNPIVEHKMARNRVLNVYREALNSN